MPLAAYCRIGSITSVISSPRPLGAMIVGSPESARMNIDDLLRIAMERRASDLHLKVGNYPHLRIDGELIPLTDQPRVSAEDMLNMAFSMMSARQKQKFKETTEIDRPTVSPAWDDSVSTFFSNAATSDSSSASSPQRFARSTNCSCRK